MSQNFEDGGDVNHDGGCCGSTFGDFDVLAISEQLNAEVRSSYAEVAPTVSPSPNLSTGNLSKGEAGPR